MSNEIAPGTAQLAGIFKAISENIEALAARCAELERGEFICKQCGLRKDAENEIGNF